MARARSGVLHALFLLAAAAGGVQATAPAFDCATSSNLTTCNALLDLWNAFGGVDYFGAGNWFDQSGADFCDNPYQLWSGTLCDYNTGNPPYYLTQLCAQPACAVHPHAYRKLTS